MTKVITKLLEGLLRLLSALPLGFHYLWAGFFAWILRDVMHYRADVVMTNLSRSFPDKKYKELKAVSDGFYRHFGEIAAEAIWFGGCRNPERLLRRRLVEIANPELLDEVYTKGRGVVVLNSHFGNWELTGGIPYYDYRPDFKGTCYELNDVFVVYKPLKNKVWNEVMRLNRCAPVLRRGYTGYVSSGEVLRLALSRKDRKSIYLFPTDQCPYRGSTSHDEVEFLHQRTRTMLGGASIAHKFGYAVLSMSLDRESRGHYIWTYRLICEDASSMTPHEIMQEYYDILQQDLERHPSNYLWSHKRWK